MSKHKTIECEEFYNLMQTYRHVDQNMRHASPRDVVEAYQAVIDYVDAALEHKPQVSQDQHYSRYYIGNCKWPRTAPVMPKSKSVINYTHDKVLEHALINQRTEIEAYWKALDEFNG